MHSSCAGGCCEGGARRNLPSLASLLEEALTRLGDASVLDHLLDCILLSSCSLRRLSGCESHRAESNPKDF